MAARVVAAPSKATLGELQVGTLICQSSVGDPIFAEAEERLVARAGFGHVWPGQACRNVVSLIHQEADPGQGTSPTFFGSSRGESRKAAVATSRRAKVGLLEAPAACLIRSVSSDPPSFVTAVGRGFCVRTDPVAPLPLTLDAFSRRNRAEDVQVLPEQKLHRGHMRFLVGKAIRRWFAASWRPWGNDGQRGPRNGL